jgi:hypothetical protein
MSKPAELHTTLVNPQIAAQVVTVAVTFTESSDADATVTLFPVSRRMRLIGSSYSQSVDATAATSYTAIIKNGSTNMTAALDIKALGAAAVSHFVPLSTDAAVLQKGDVVSVAFNETGGTATSPEIVWMMLEFQLLS